MPRFRTIRMEVDPTETVETLKLKLSKEGFPVNQQRLVSPDGLLIPDVAKLVDFKIASGSTVHLVLTPGETKKPRKQ